MAYPWPLTRYLLFYFNSFVYGESILNKVFFYQFLFEIYYIRYCTKNLERLKHLLEFYQVLLDM